MVKYGSSKSPDAISLAFYSRFLPLGGVEDNIREKQSTDLL